MYLRTVEAFGQVAAAFIYSDLVGKSTLGGSRNRRTGCKQILPFMVEINQGGDVWLPGFKLQVIKLLLVISHFGLFVKRAS